MNILKKLLFVVFAVVVVVTVQAAPAKAYSNENMIDNAVFDNKDAMNESQIRAFIQSRPNTCLTRVGAGLGGGNIFDEPMDYFTYGPNKVDAARVIYKAAQYNEINPRVILATLQKEQSMITDSDCYSDAPSLNKAMGYACYEGADACPASWAAGFEKQIMKGAWQLAFDRQRAEGNTSWGGNDSITYGGRMTEGNRRRCGTCTLIYYDGYSVIDGVNTRMGNGATASLYNYTPHRNQSFPYWFEQFFGSGATTAAQDPAYPLWVVFRAFNKYSGKHLYTMDVDEWKNSPKFGYSQENYVFIQYPSATNVPLWRLNNPQKRKYFYTTSYAEADYAARRLGYIIEGVAFNVEPALKPGLKPVYRVYNPYIDNHLFTQSITERDQALTQKWYINEGIAWYSY